MERHGRRIRCAREMTADYLGRQSTMTTEELIRLLNTLLRMERAGAEAFATFLNDYPRGTPAWRQIAGLQRDEARNSVILTDLIRRVNGTACAATGNFLAAALAAEDRIARLQFINRAQKWVAQSISEALPYVEQGFVRGALFAMQESHLLNIEACDALVEAMEA
jgi:hypothetical protein